MSGLLFQLHVSLFKLSIAVMLVLKFAE